MIHAPTKYRLRWRFDFEGGGSSIGIWSHPGDVAKNGAWRQTKLGRRVRLAMIEGKDLLDSSITVLASCSGAEFVQFEWRALAFSSLRSGHVGTRRTVIDGLSLITHDHVIHVNTAGDVSHTLRPKSHKQIEFATYGK